ncbi:MAG: P1 family peptidase, partial [Chloroflexi bacterium]|nr:P1 family peptidase [Chloroflexota bacterium]
MSEVRQKRPRARELGIVVGELPTGTWNAITDVEGVLVGHCTLISGHGPLVPGKGPVRTGVTAVLPHGGNIFRDKVAASAHVINGFGKCMGLPQVLELGTLETPVLLTNTLNVGIVADACIQWSLEQNPDIGIATSTVNPVVGECNDGFLNDIQGRHVRAEHVFAALNSAASGPVEEGAVGAGTGMSAFGFKAGVGTASRKLPAAWGAFTVGVLLVANFG